MVNRTTSFRNKVGYFEGTPLKDTQRTDQPVDKPTKQIWTHRSVKTGGDDNLRQIDYIMVGSRDRWRLQNVDTEDELHVGGDHRTVTATLKIRTRQPKNKKNGKRETIANLKSWEPQNKDHYASVIDKAITT